MNSREQLGWARGRKLGLRLSALAVFGAVSAWEATASAQPIDFQANQVERFPDARSSTPDFRWIINYEECMAEDKNSYFRFNLSVSGWDANESFEVWGSANGADCTIYDQRVGVNAGCTKLVPRAQVTRNNTNPQIFSTEFDVKDLVALDKGLAADKDCGASSADITQRNVKIYFMLTSSGQFVDGSSRVWDKTKIDLWGPAPPTDVAFMSGEGSVVLELAGPYEELSTVVAYCAKDGVVPLDEETTSDSSCSCFAVGDDSASGGSAGSGTGGNGGAAGMGVSSSSSSSSSSVASSGMGGAGGGGMSGAGGASGMAGAGGASGMAGAGGIGGMAGAGGIGGMAGAGGSGGMASTGGSGGMASTGGSGGGSAGGSSSDSTCDHGDLVANAIPDPKWKTCAESTTTIKGLENNVTYAIAAAYRDQVGNVGRLSSVVCATPEPIEDFFENYVSKGGSAGGGYCSISHRSLRNTSFGASFALGALALAFRRRSRPSRNGAAKEESK